MPNYVSHAVMAEKTDFISPIELDKSLIRSYAIGQDLMKFSKDGLNPGHNTNSQAFFLNLVNYIVLNRLQDSPQIMSYLYGHIMHYALDKIMHPYIYYMTNDIPDKGVIDFHMASEEYLGYYLLQKKLGIRRKDITRAFFTDFQWSSSLELMIDYIYKKVYGTPDAFKAQRKTGNMIKTLDFATHFMQSDNGKKYLELICFYKYLEMAQMSESDLTNEDHKIWFNPITGKSATKSILDLVDDAIEFAKELIESVQVVIYGGKSLDTLKSVFDNSSYDTGLDCSIGKPFKRSRIKDYEIR